MVYDFYIFKEYQIPDICVPISNDSHILWSSFKIRQDNEHEMELGVMPDGPVMFMNDSIQPNCRVNVSVKKGLHCTQDLVLTGLSNHEVPIEFELEALKPIQPGKELFWCYRPEAKRSKTSGNGSSSVSYRPSHINGNHTQADYTAIESHMKSAFSGQFSVKRTDDLSAILQRRLEIETTRKKADLKYTPRESKFLPLIRRNQCTRGKVIEQAESNIIALKAYLKFRLNSCKDVFEALNNTRTIFARHTIPVPHKGYKKDGSHCKWGFYDFYRFCFESNFITPEDDVQSVSLEWLGEKISQHKENSRWIRLLKKRLKIALLKNDNILVFTENLQRYVPNPLRNYEKSWTAEEIERLGGVARLTQRMVTKNTVDCYLTEKENTTLLRGASRKIYEAAKKGSVEAQICIITRRLSKKSDLASLLIDLKKSKIHLMVNGVYIEPSKKSLIQFIKQNFTKQDQKKYLGYTGYTDQELMFAMKKKKKLATSVNVEINRRIRKGGHLNLLKAFIAEKSKTIQFSSTLLKQLNAAGINYRGQSPFTLKHLRQIFKPGEQPSVDKFFKATISDERLLKELATKGPRALGANRELLRRCQTNAGLAVTYLRTCWKHSIQTKPEFCRHRASLLNRHKIPTSTGSSEWTANTIEENIRSMRKNPDKTSKTGRKSYEGLQHHKLEPTVKPCLVKLEKIENANELTRIKVGDTSWEKEKWCGKVWWERASDLERIAENNTFSTLQSIRLLFPELYEWLQRMQLALTKTKTITQTKKIFLADFEGTQLSKRNINIMVGWINNSLNKMGFPNLQELSF